MYIYFIPLFYFFYLRTCDKFENLKRDIIATSSITFNLFGATLIIHRKTKLDDNHELNVFYTPKLDLIDLPKILKKKPSC